MLGLNYGSKAVHPEKSVSGPVPVTLFRQRDCQLMQFDKRKKRGGIYEKKNG